jgi:hypothetical protein
MQNEKGQGVSHASNSALPQKAQEKVCCRLISSSGHCLITQVPSSIEHQVPDALHDTGSNKETGKVSHATGDSKVPKFLQGMFLLPPFMQSPC